jgi:hypothetical protein
MALPIRHSRLFGLLPRQLHFPSKQLVEEAQVWLDKNIESPSACEQVRVHQPHPLELHQVGNLKSAPRPGMHEGQITYDNASASRDANTLMVSIRHLF